MSDPQQRRPRRWFQFSLRTLLIVTAAVAGLAFGYVKIVEPYRLQRGAMEAITKLGGTYTTEDATGWVRYLDKQAQNVVVVDLADCDKPDEYLPHLARLPKLRTLVVGGHSVGDEQVSAFGRMASLRGLVLDSTKVSDKAVDGIKETIPGLIAYRSQRRAVASLRIGVYLDPGTPPLGHQAVTSSLPGWLVSEAGDQYFFEPPVLAMINGSDTDLTWVSNLVNVRHVEVGGKKAFSDDGLSHLAALRELQVLNASGTRITDKGIPYLEKCSRLNELYITGTGITLEGVRRLKAALPKCDIRY